MLKLKRMKHLTVLYTVYLKLPPMHVHNALTSTRLLGIHSVLRARFGVCVRFYRETVMAKSMLKSILTSSNIEKPAF